MINEIIAKYGEYRVATSKGQDEIKKYGNAYLFKVKGSVIFASSKDNLADAEQELMERNQLRQVKERL